MARQARTIIPGQAMHVMVRGNNREMLFFNDADRRIYLDWFDAQSCSSLDDSSERRFTGKDDAISR